MNEENKPKRHYKVESGDIFIVYRNDIIKFINKNDSVFNNN